MKLAAKLVMLAGVVAAVLGAAVQSEAAAPAGAVSIEGAAAFIQALGEHAIAVFASGAERGEDAQRVEAIERIVLDNVDLPAIGRFALGGRWREMDAAQKARYGKVFRDYVLIATARRLDAYRFAHFHIASSQPIAQGDILVETIVERPDGPEVRVGWRVRAETEGFKIVDVIAEGMSMALTQRQEFTSVIGRAGLESLIRLLEGKVAEFQAAPGRN